MRVFALGLLAGVCALQQQAVLPAADFCIALLCAAFFTLFLMRSCPVRGLRWLIIFVAACVLGFSWAALRAEWRMTQTLPASLEEQDIRVTGIIDSLPDVVERGLRFYFAVENAQSLDGKALVLPSRIVLGLYANEAEAVPALQPGERWQWTVRLRRPHGNANPFGFDYEAWLLSEGIRATGSVRPAEQQRLTALVWRPGALIARARGALRARIMTALPHSEYAGVMVALVMGDQRAVNDADWTIFNRTGIGHLVSISGLHITMIAALFAGLVQWLWRHSFFTRASLPLRLPAQKAGAAAGLVAAFGYVALAGFGIPAQRTLMMLCVMAAALWGGRIVAVSQALCMALVVVLLLDPWAVLWPGFWLSFAAIACIFYGAAQPAARGWRHSLLAAAHTQRVITLGLVPLTMLLFAQVSLVAPLANAVAIPLVSFLITPLSLLGSIAPAPVSVWLLQAAHALLALLAQVLTKLSALPLAVWSAPQPDMLSFILALAGTLWLLAPRGWPWRWMGLLAWLPLLLTPAAAPKQGVWVTAFDIGQGNAVLIETATHRLLYDTGPKFSAESDSASRVLLPYFRARGISQLDALIISHSDSDHAGGALSVLHGMTLGWVASSLPATHPIVQQAPHHHPCVAGQSWSWDGVRFEMLHPAPASYAIASLRPNARSCTLKISYRHHALLLAGDIEAAQERELLASRRAQLPSTVLLAPHHGSGTSSTLAFLQAVAPEIALFQLGYHNRYHHPKPEVFERYGALGIRRLRSDETGAVRLVMDEAVTFSAYRTESPRYWWEH